MEIDKIKEKNMQASSTSVALPGKSKGKISLCHFRFFIHLTIPAPPNLIYIAYHLYNTESFKSFLSSNIFAMFLWLAVMKSL